MDFFASQEQAQRKTTLLVCYFVLAVICIVAMNYLVLGFLLGNLGQRGNSWQSYWDPELLLAVALGTLCVIGIGSLFKTASLTSGGVSVAEMFNARRIDPNSTDLHERRLLNVVEEMAIASGTPVPPVYLLDHEYGINAFAAGFAPSDAVITVTRGTLQTLSRDELQGVIGHEFSHILHGDMRLNIRLMGVLYGILAISTIGWFLFRATGNTVSYSNSDDREKKGGNPLPLIGLALYVIGYVGVFFGKLIKSAVSRQREFLADASSVQYTRNPDGIVGALKKIGGIQQGSKIEHPAAEEASHMFFGRGISETLFGWMDTHPPLHERIRRIDPSFDGTYPLVAITSDDGQPEYYQPEFQQAAGFASTAPGVQPAVDGPVLAQIVDPAEISPKSVAAHVGSPRTVHLQRAAAVLDTLPNELLNLAREPNSARALVFALMLDTNPAIRQQQLTMLSQMADGFVQSTVNRVLPSVEALHAACRLPLAQLTLPALRHLSPGQFAQFQQTVQHLAAADRQLSLFEYALQWVLLRHLGANYADHAPREVKFSDIVQVKDAVVNLLGVLAYAGANPAADQQAFAQGIAACFGQGVQFALPAPGAVNLQMLDTALGALALASPAIKRRVLSGCTACIAVDGKISVAEGELLRVIADALDCPMPPLTLPMAAQ